MPDNGAYKTLAKGFELLAEGLRLLADRETESPPAESPEQQGSVTLGRICNTMHAKCDEGKRDKVKELLSKYTAAKLSDIRPDDYNCFFRELEAL